MGELLQPMHLLVIVVVALFLFGPKKLPELGKGLGDGIRNFRESMKQAAETKPAETTPQDTTTHDHVA
jgi:sec-independent protein translocase protein TatA